MAGTLEVLCGAISQEAGEGDVTKAITMLDRLVALRSGLTEDLEGTADETLLVHLDDQITHITKLINNRK